MGPGTADLPPRLERGHASDTGSAFREAVWPPPVDNARYESPLAESRAIDLSDIIDSVMGPQAAHEVPRPWVGSSHSVSGGGHTRNSSDSSFGSEGRSGAANESQIALLEAAGLATPRSQGTAVPTTADGSPKAWIQRSPLRPQTPSSQNQAQTQTLQTPSGHQSQDQERRESAGSESVYSR